MMQVSAMDNTEIIPFLIPVRRIAAGLISLISEATLQTIRCPAFIDNENFSTLKNPAAVIFATGIMTASKILSFTAFALFL